MSLLQNLAHGQKGWLLHPLPKPGVGKLFAQRATFLKNGAAEGRTLSLQSKKIYSVCK